MRILITLIISIAICSCSSVQNVIDDVDISFFNTPMEFYSDDISAEDSSRIIKLVFNELICNKYRRFDLDSTSSLIPSDFDFSQNENDDNSEKLLNSSLFGPIRKEKVPIPEYKYKEGDLVCFLSLGRYVDANQFGPWQKIPQKIQNHFNNSGYPIRELSLLDYSNGQVKEKLTGRGGYILSVHLRKKVSDTEFVAWGSSEMGGLATRDYEYLIRKVQGQWILQWTGKMLVS